MQAVTYYRYGSPGELQIEEIPTPVPTDDEIRIKIHAVSINGADKENLVGTPLYVRMAGLRAPKNPILGSDIAGTVETVGKNVTEFKPGDALFGEIPGYHGGFAEYVCVDGKTMLPKPAGLSFLEAAAIPQAGTIAYKGIIDNGQVQPGQSVLINGGGGSAGSFAIQLAKYAGAEVTGVDNAMKLDFMRTLGADHVIDYAQEDFTRSGRGYDLILDVIAHRGVSAYTRALNPGGRCYVVGGAVGKMLQILALGSLTGRGENKKVQILAVPQSREGLIPITDLCATGTIRPAIDRHYTLHQVPEAMRYVLEGHAKGKVVINVAGSG